MHDPSTIVADPRWLAHRYDPQRDEFWFRPVDRGARAAATFLTDEYLGVTEAIRLHRAVAIQAVASRPIHFIFHSAYCCSTLLAQILDSPGLTSTLKEPVILNDLVGWRHRGGRSGDVSSVLDAALTLLARPFDPVHEAMVVKPSNVVNALAPAILRLRPDARALLLFAPLDVYLASIARKGMWGRLWVRDLFTKQVLDGLIDMGLAPGDHIGLTDLQIAAVGWLAQKALFARLAEEFPKRTRSIDSETLLQRPSEALTGIAELYGWSVGSDTIEALAASPAFARDAKNGAPFQRGQRVDDRLRGAELHAEEITMVTTWIEAVARNAGIALVPPNPLIA